MAEAEARVTQVLTGWDLLRKVAAAQALSGANGAAITDARQSGNTSNPDLASSA